MRYSRQPGLVEVAALSVSGKTLLYPASEHCLETLILAVARVFANSVKDLRGYLTANLKRLRGREAVR